MTKLIYAFLSVTFFLAMNSSLTKMTIADCNYGIEAACEQLQK